MCLISISCMVSPYVGIDTELFESRKQQENRKETKQMHTKGSLSLPERNEVRKCSKLALISTRENKEIQFLLPIQSLPQYKDQKTSYLSLDSSQKDDCQGRQPPSHHSRGKGLRVASRFWAVASSWKKSASCSQVLDPHIPCPRPSVWHKAETWSSQNRG